MNIPTEFVRVDTVQGTTYILMVSLTHVVDAGSISGTSSIPVVHAIEPIYRLIHTLFGANKTNAVRSTYAQNLVPMNTVENYLEHNLH